MLWVRGVVREKSEVRIRGMIRVRGLDRGVVRVFWCGKGLG